MHRILLSLAVIFGAVSGTGLEAKRAGCLDLRKSQGIVSVSGVLTVQRFAGPPNYESVAKGDVEEKALILKLARSMCADDGEFIDGKERFDRVQVSSHDDKLLKALNAAIGRRVTVRGEAFGAYTGHHRAPVVLFAVELTINQR